MLKTLIAGLIACAVVTAANAMPVTAKARYVTDYGAVCDGVTDDSAAFDRAILNTPAGGTILVPASGGVAPEGPGAGGGSASELGLGCVVKTSFGTQHGGDHHNGSGAIYAAAVNITGDGPGAAIKCIDDAQNGTPCIWTTDTGLADLGNAQAGLHNLQIYWSGPAPSSTTDTVWISGANNAVLENLVLGSSCCGGGAGEDGVHVFSAWSNGWVESLLIRNVRVSRSGRDNFHFEVSDGCTGCFITQTTILNSTSRLPGRYALELASLNNQNGNYKISGFQWIGGELDCSYGSAADCTHITQASNSVGQAVESVLFQGVAIEDSFNGNHTGFAVGVTKTGSAAIGPVNLIDVIYYGEAQGALDTSQLGSWSVESCASGQQQWCRQQDRLGIASEAGLSFTNQTIHTGASRVTLDNAPCRPGRVQEWLAVPINGTTYYIPACHP